MPVTIRDVARQLNLSITTVSRALDGYDDVSEETRQRVITTAHQMGYAPSRAARQLRRGKSDTIGLIIPSQEPRFTDPAFLELIAGLGDGSASQGLDMLVSTAAPDSEAEQSIYQHWVQTRRVDGIVLTRIRVQDWRAEYLAQSGFPFVATGHSLSETAFPFVEVDGQAGMSLLVSHLASTGHTRIAYIGASSDLVIQTDRFAGYRQALQDLGLPFAHQYVATGNLTRPGGYQAAQQLLNLPEPPTAIAAINDLTAIGILRLATERGLQVGRDLAVTGFDGISDAETVQPPLTTLNIPVYDIGQRLVAMLTQLIQGEPLPDPHVRLTPNLVIRASSGG